MTDKNGDLHKTYYDCSLYNLYCITLYQNGKVQESKDAYIGNYGKNTTYTPYRGFLLYLLETENIPQTDKLWAKEQAYRLADDMESHTDAYVEAANAFARDNPYNFVYYVGAEHIPAAYAHILRELADSV